VASLAGAQVVFIESPVLAQDRHGFSRRPLAETPCSIDCVRQSDARQETVLVRMLNLATNNDSDGAGRLQWQRCLLRLVTRSSAPNDRNQEEDCQWRSHSVFTQRTTQLSDGDHGARLQPRRPATVSCGALGHTSSLNLIVNTSLADSINLINVELALASQHGVSIRMSAATLNVVSAKHDDAGNGRTLLNCVENAAHACVAKPEKLRVRWALRLGAEMTTEKPTNAVRLSHVKNSHCGFMR